MVLSNKVHPFVFLNIYSNNTGMQGIGDFIMITLVLHAFIYLIGYTASDEEWTGENIGKKIFKLEMIYLVFD